MMYDLAHTERKHLAIQNEPPPVVLRAKACACGAQATARQLAQHGKCSTCVLTADITADDLAKLQFMLGAVPGRDLKHRWGARNHYCCGVQDRAAMERLVSAGLARVGAPLLTSLYFHATTAGCRAVGMGAAGIRLALEARP